jgi:hypothetical protein
MEVEAPRESGDGIVLWKGSLSGFTMARAGCDEMLLQVLDGFHHTGYIHPSSREYRVPCLSLCTPIANPHFVPLKPVKRRTQYTSNLTPSTRLPAPPRLVSPYVNSSPTILSTHANVHNHPYLGLHSRSRIRRRLSTGAGDEMSDCG